MQTNAALMSDALAAEPNNPAAAAAFTDAVTEDGGAAGFVGYHPEMGEARPVAHMEARLSHYGKHYYIDTPLTLKGRGIEYVGTETDSRCRRAGWDKYKVTLKAFAKLETQYRIASEMLL